MNEKRKRLDLSDWETKSNIEYVVLITLVIALVATLIWFLVPALCQTLGWFCT